MSAYFSHFPKIYYNQQVSRNIILKSKLFNEVLGDYTAFYPYTVKEGDRADHVAEWYYGKWEYEWLVYFSNELIDPHFGWVLSQNDLESYIKKKYGSYEFALDNVKHYVYNDTVVHDDMESLYRLNYIMPTETYNFLTPVEKSFWKPVYIYEYEFQKNEDKRHIKLLTNELTNQVEKEISRILEKR